MWRAASCQDSGFHVIAAGAGIGAKMLEGAKQRRFVSGYGTARADCQNEHRPQPYLVFACQNAIPCMLFRH
jgi:hypothetical protein